MIDAWMGLAVILSFVLLLPFLLRAGRRIVKQTGFSFPYPLLVLAASAGFCCAMLCPPIYAMGTTEICGSQILFIFLLCCCFLSMCFMCAAGAQ